MNILHVTPYYAPAWAFGGVVQAVQGLAETQAARGHHVTVLTTDALDRTQRMTAVVEVMNGVQVLRRRNVSQALRGYMSLSTPLGFAAQLRRLILEDGIDLIHCHELRTVENLSVSSLAPRDPIPVIVSPHGTIPYSTGRGWAKRSWDRTLGHRLLGCTDQVLALTSKEASDVKALWAQMRVPIRDEQISTIPNGVRLPNEYDATDRSSARSRWNLGEGPVILYVGRLESRKRLSVLVKAFGILAQSEPHVRLILAGPDWGSRARLEREIEAARLSNRVTVTGLLDPSGKSEVYQFADLFVLPSVGEGLSIALLEAMGNGLPVILTEEGNLPEVVDAGAGLVVPSTVAGLAEAMRVLCADPGLGAQMGRRGRGLVESRYSWPQIASQVEWAYRAVLDRAGRSLT